MRASVLVCAAAEPTETGFAAHGGPVATTHWQIQTDTAVDFARSRTERRYVQTYLAPSFSEVVAFSCGVVHSHLGSFGLLSL